MGCCAAADKANAAITKELANCKNQSDHVRKLLFLGSGGSGKSTFFKQMCLIHGEGFTPEDRSSYHIDICAQILEQISRMLEGINILNEYYFAHSTDHPPLQISSNAQNAVLFIHSLSLREIIDTEIAQNVEILWSEAALKTVYEERAILHIDDSINYFLDDIQRIGSFRENYVPTDMDIINVRHRTTGVTSKTFIIEQNGFSLFDVGGQQSERKKWIHCFEDVTAVIFVASLSCYDESVFENREKNAMHDTLELFDDICNNKWFVDTPIILFLNKNDLFKEKILKHVSLSVCFDDFKEIEEEVGGNVESETYLKCLQFIKEKFQEKNYNNNESRGVHMHVTTATDTSNVQYVFHSVQALVISQCLQTLI